nr:retrovirus-related Pol polyprotein from transposon TNT 1-94 [Tanacetum cinerariifolium]
KVYRLRKALYGLKHAPRAWYDELSTFLTSKGFTKGTSSVNKSSSLTDNSKRQDTPPTMNIQSLTEPTIPTNANTKENNDNQVEDEFTNPFCTLDFGFELIAFSDADHAGCIDTLKSTSGGIQFLGDKLFSWMSKKQDCTAMSLAKVGYMALSASCAQVMWRRKQLKDYGFYYNKIQLYCDSQSAIAISCNPVQHSCTKHIHTRYHFIKEQVENRIIELYFVKTEYQLANMFTKALLEDRFKYLVRRIGRITVVTLVKEQMSPWHGDEGIISMVSISPEDFLPSILLLVVVIVTVVIVAVILVVVVVVIDGVVIVVMIIRVEVVVMIIGVVIVVGVSFIIKLSLVIIGLEVATFPSILRGNHPMKASRSFSESNTILGHKVANSWNLLTYVLRSFPFIVRWLSKEFHHDKASSVKVPVANFTLQSSSGGGVTDLTGDEDPTNEDRDTGVGDSEVSVSLGEISPGGRKSQESSISDTEDRSKEVGRAIIV